MPELAEISCRHCPLRSTGAFSTNTEHEIAFIENFKRNEIRVAAGDTILRERENRGELYTLLSGWAFRYRTMSDGRRQIFNFLLPGDFAGLQNQLEDAAQHGIEALTDARLCVFPRNRLWDLYHDHPALGFDITWLSAHEELIVDENLLSVGRRSATERIAMLLVHLYKRASCIGLCDDEGIQLPLTQQHFADALGLSLVHTNKTLRYLQKLGFFTLKNGKLKLINPAAIARLADYHALPLRGRPLI